MVMLVCIWWHNRNYCLNGCCFAGRMQSTLAFLWKNNCNCFKMSSYCMFLKWFKQLKQSASEFCLVTYFGLLDYKWFFNLGCKLNLSKECFQNKIIFFLIWDGRVKDKPVSWITNTITFKSSKFKFMRFDFFIRKAYLNNTKFHLVCVVKQSTWKINCLYSREPLYFIDIHIYIRQHNNRPIEAFFVWVSRCLWLSCFWLEIVMAASRQQCQ